MKIEKLEVNSKKVKVAFILGIILTASIFILINYLTSKANYRNTQSVELISGNITYTVPDLNAIAMYKNDGSGDKPITTMPGVGYELDTRSYCYTTNPSEHDTEVNLSTDDNGNLVIGGLKKGSKCFFYFKKAFKPQHSGTLGMLEKASKSNFTVTSLTSVTKDQTSTKGKVYSYSENGGTTYVFRGAPKDNWAVFGKDNNGNYIWWRIVRINSDGTLRMIYTGTSTATNTPPTGSTATQTKNAIVMAVTSTKYNVSYKNNTYVGYYYGSESGNYTQTHSNSSPSTIATAVKTWYGGTNLGSLSSKLSGHTGFCNDRRIGTSRESYTGDGSGANQTIYAPSSRLTNTSWDYLSPVVPDLSCNKNDLFTTSTDAGSGNGALDIPVGLITADEVALAGMLYDSDGKVTSNYMHVGEYYWTMSPSGYNSYASSYANVFRVAGTGYLDYDNVYTGATTFEKYGVRPVINVIPDNNFTGAGTYQNPYVFAT